MDIPLLILIISSSILFIIGLILLLAYVTFAITFKRQKKPTMPYDGLDRPSFHRQREHSKALIDYISSVEWQRVSTTAHDGTTLSALYHHAGDNYPLQIMCHGYKSHPLKDMSGGGTEALKRGYNLLLIEHRAHHTSGGKCLTFGAKECYDIQSWVNWHNEKFNTGMPIVLVGISMGAATVILASALDLPENVRCVIADCPYSSAEEILKKEIAKRHLPVCIFYPLMCLGTRLFGGFEIDKANVTDAAKKKRLPLLLLHGEDDDFVPLSMSRKIAEAASGECHLHTFPEARHGTSYLQDPVRYMKIVDDFLSVHLGDKE